MKLHCANFSFSEQWYENVRKTWSNIGVIKQLQEHLRNEQEHCRFNTYTTQPKEFLYKKFLLKSHFFLTHSYGIPQKYKYCLERYSFCQQKNSCLHLLEEGPDKIICLIQQIS